jgi:hypothetical protein
VAKDTVGGSVDELFRAVGRIFLAQSDADAHAAFVALMKMNKSKDAVIPLLVWARRSNERNRERQRRIEALEAQVHALEEHLTRPRRNEP